MDVFLSTTSIKTSGYGANNLNYPKRPSVLHCLKVMKGGIHFTLRWRFWLIFVVYFFMVFVHKWCPTKRSVLGWKLLVQHLPLDGDLHVWNIQFVTFEQFKDQETFSWLYLLRCEIMASEMSFLKLGGKGKWSILF